jgi:hypothetical protein
LCAGGSCFGCGIDDRDGVLGQTKEAESSAEGANSGARMNTGDEADAELETNIKGETGG